MTIYVAGKPTNLNFAPGVKAEEVTSDLYGIMDRLKENHPAISVIKIVDGDGYVYVVTERDVEDTDHFMFRTYEIDGRLEERLDRIRRIPFAQRFAEAEKIEAESKAEAEAQASAEFYENFGDPMRRQLIKDNFGSGLGGVSYPKRGAKDRNRK